MPIFEFLYPFAKAKRQRTIHNHHLTNILCRHIHVTDRKDYNLYGL